MTTDSEAGFHPMKPAIAKIIPFASPSDATLAPQHGMLPPHREPRTETAAPVAAAPSAPLSSDEKAALEECEGILDRGLGTFFDVGNALLRIRESRLYRARHPTFEQYCHERWNMGRSYASRVMGAAERLKLLPTDESLPRPVNEFQVRPFLKLASEEFPKAWRQAVKIAKEGKVTPTIVQAVIDRLLEPNAGVLDVAQSAKRRKSKTKLPLGQILALLTETRRSVEKGAMERALAALERIEKLLCEL